jgi:VanZ family protein
MTIKAVAKFCSVAAIILLVIAALGPANWAPRSGLGFQIDHIVGYFVITLIACVAWPRPIVVGGAFMVVSGLLEGLQAFTPDRHASLEATLYGAGGALAAALLAELFIRARRRCAEP